MSDQTLEATKQTLWSVYTLGMDEYEAASSLKAARGRCHAINEAILRRGHDDENEPNVWCYPQIWPWDAETHAADLLKRTTEAA